MAAHYDDDRKENSRGEQKSCCTWPKIVVMMVLVLAIGIVIWKFAPIDDALDNVLPDFNSTTLEDTLGDAIGQNNGPTAAPIVQQPDFQFMQCADESKNCCNGLDTICDLGVDDIMYASVHNAMATFQDGFLFGANHRFKMESALDAGYRGINLDVCNCGGNYQFCHGVCNLGSRDVEDTFFFINSFLERNPTEVLLITLQINNDVQDDVDLNVLFSQMKSVTGFTDKLYVHKDPNADWPTLRQVVAADTRVLMFHYNGPECRDGVTCPAGLHYWFDYAVESEYRFATALDVQNIPRSCNVTRGSTRDTFYAINSFVTPPSQSVASGLNSYDFAKSHIAACSEFYSGLDVNLVYADFWSEGDLPQVTQEHNTALAQARRKQRRKLRKALE